MKKLLFLVLLCLGCDSAKRMVGMQTAEAGQIELLQKQLKEADVMVQQYADELQGSSGFIRDNPPRLDPWGNMIKVEYGQQWFTETATVSSAGPDGKFGTSDDLKRLRTASNVFGVMNGLPGWVWFALVWMGCGLLAFLLSSGISNRRSVKGLKGHRRSLSVLIVIVAAPLVFLVYLVQFLGGLVFDGDFFDGFDFEFD